MTKPDFTFDAYAIKKEAAKLERQLAKANERVKELEIERQFLISEIEPLLDMQDGGEYYTRNSLADDIYEKFIGGSSSEALNNFALEQKIEALEECVGVCGFLSCEDSLKARIKQLRNQLRKGGE